jgi:ABC-type multidrug transport system fused ATPase/permease subunit
LTISTAFTCLALFDQLRRPLLNIPDIVVNVLEAWVAYKRIREYIESPELEDYINIGNDDSAKDSSLIRFITGSKFTWNSDPAEEINGQHNSFTLNNVGISFPKDGLTIIYGATGSGKSTLLSAILGELNVLAGGVILNGGKGKKTSFSVAYASQQGKYLGLIQYGFKTLRSKTTYYSETHMMPRDITQ